jgi:1,4-dihydroxy-2-naphthoate octaprenyltransferase
VNSGTTEIAAAQARPVSRGNLRKGFWMLADPRISLASISSVFLGACLAAREQPIHFGWLLVTLIGVFAVEVAKNASGELVDFDSGTDLAVAPEDRSPFSGGKRVLVDGVLTRVQTRAIAGISYAAAITAGIGIVAFREPSVLFLGLFGVACAFFYH